jgi:predicted TPR repeat methyltransferase
VSAEQLESAVAGSDAAASLGERMAAAVREHQAGQLVAAEGAYRALLAEHPDDANAAHFLGVLRFQEGGVEEGLALLGRSVEKDPANPHAWNNLGNMYVQIKRDGEAEQAYLRATSLNPDLAAATYNLARIYIRDHRFEAAIEALRKIIPVFSGSTNALQTLASLYYRLGRPDEARWVYERWAEQAPDDPTPQHMLAAISGRSVPDRADDRYIVKTFDGFAPSFDTQLTQLHYSAPQLVASRLIDHPLYLSGRAALLDAGCGTGWCGPLLRSTAGRLVGVDLSSGMLAQAQQRNVYDELHKAELTEFMTSHPALFDFIVSADVLCYFGRLDAAIRAAHDALLPDGLLCFSVEALKDAAPGEGFRLGGHGRYAHAQGYLEQVMAAAGFAAPAIEGGVLRLELGKPVEGYIVAGRRAGS